MLVQRDHQHRGCTENPVAIPGIESRGGGANRDHQIRRRAAKTAAQKIDERLGVIGTQSLASIERRIIDCDRAARTCANSVRNVATTESYGANSRPNECNSSTRLATVAIAPAGEPRATTASNRATVQGLRSGSGIRLQCSIGDHEKRRKPGRSQESSARLS